MALEPLTGPHTNTTTGWMEDVFLLLVAAACTTLMIWLIQQLVIQPRYTPDRAFELGYYAGRTDAQTENRPSLGIVTDFPSSTGKTGT